MFVPNTNMIYFAFPKCASKWMQQELRLRPNNKYKPMLWDGCDMKYYHVRPLRYIQYHNVDRSKFTMFTIVRNTYDRLVSAWAYGVATNTYAKGMTFAEFIEYLYVHRNNLLTLPYCWMFLPVEVYFDGVLQDIQFFHMENLADCAAYFRDKYKMRLRDRVVNATKHQPYETYYTPKLVNMVKEIYGYEIERFGYASPLSTTHT